LPVCAGAEVIVEHKLPPIIAHPAPVMSLRRDIIQPLLSRPQGDCNRRHAPSV